MDLTNKTIREIVLEMPLSTRVFEELKIDYCCGGEKKFSEACEIANVSQETVIDKILAQTNVDPDDIQTNQFIEQMSPAKLIDLIVEKHHSFTKTEIERLRSLAEKVVIKHGELHPELLDLKNVFVSLSDDLIQHMQKEEAILFPFVKQLQVAEITNESAPRAPFGTVKDFIRMMKSEHDTAGDYLKRIRSLTNDFVAPEDACPSFKALYFGLHELQKDLHRHIHLENNILFPLAEGLEDTGR
jgi:regulator of cell morphogenesis and NO signaling